jgi:hypothetical protein
MLSSLHVIVPVFFIVIVTGYLWPAGIVGGIDVETT